jgi:hypothetical protein
MGAPPNVAGSGSPGRLTLTQFFVKNKPKTKLVGHARGAGSAAPR